jgi:DNA polymerase-3 subunit gamma/tau
MSYLVLARKYRPRHFAEMVGQGHVVQALSNALSSGRLHHAYLFTGTRGVGKTTVARILAKSLNCVGADGQGGITATPCGVCQACVDIDSGRFVDYTELDAASNRSVDEMQSLLEQAVYKPVQGRFKVFMIDEVHMLTGHAFNAMLKTLEEPPDYLKFVLATTDPQKVPVTVLSRCLQFSLRPMAPETVREHLQHVLAAEHISSDAGALRLLARAARGSMRDALSLTDQAIAFGAGRIDEAMVRQMLGSVDQSYVFQLLDALAQGDGAAVCALCEVLRTHGLSAASALEDMASVLQRMAVCQVGGAAPDEDSDPDAARIAQLASAFAPDETQLLYSLCLHGRADLGLAPDEYAALTMVLLRLLAFKPETAGAKPAALQEKKSLNSPPPAPQPPPGRRLPVRDSAPAADAVAAPMAVAAQTAAPARPVRAGDAVDAADAVLQEVHLERDKQDGLPQTVWPGDEALEALPAGDAHLFAEAPAGDGAPVLATARADAPARLIGIPVRSASPVAPEPAVAAPLEPTEEGAFWFGVVQALVDSGAVNAMARELALQSQLMARDEGQWLLRVERESLNQASSRERLTAAVRAAGYPVDVVVEIGRVGDCPVRRSQAASQSRLDAARRLIESDPFVQRMVQEFGAKIVPGSIQPL